MPVTSVVRWRVVEWRLRPVTVPTGREMLPAEVSSRARRELGTHDRCDCGNCDCGNQDSMIGATGGGEHVIAGRYRLVERLGAGGMSVVWRGQTRCSAVRSRSRCCAAARWRPDIPATGCGGGTGRRPAAPPAHHRIFDFGDLPAASTAPYVVMELVDGESSGRALAGGARCPGATRSHRADVAAALATAHARGIVHRDVKPANVMLTGAGAKVVDFGISALGRRAGRGAGRQPAGHPRTSRRSASAAAGPPAADVYAVGILLYRSLTGHLPWPGTTTATCCTPICIRRRHPCRPWTGCQPPWHAHIRPVCRQAAG